MTTKDKIEIIRKTPALLEELIEEIPVELLKVQRIPGKWSIHEHACHLAEAQDMMIERFMIFKSVENPEFKPYLPGSNPDDETDLMTLDLTESLQKFRDERVELVELLNSFSEQNWKNEGKHPEYKNYNPEIFLRHIMMHDHLHMYRIEELWITNDEFLRKN